MNTNISDNLEDEMQYAKLSQDEIIDIIKFEKELNKERKDEVYLLAFKRQ